MSNASDIREVFDEILCRSKFLSSDLSDDARAKLRNSHPKAKVLISNADKSLIQWIGEKHNLTLSQSMIKCLPDYAFYAKNKLIMLDVKNSIKYKDSCSVSNSDFFTYKRLQDKGINVMLLFRGSDNLFKIGYFDSERCHNFGSYFLHPVRHFLSFPTYWELVERLITDITSREREIKTRKMANAQ